MFSFRWKDLVSDEFVEYVCNASGADYDGSFHEIKKNLVRIVELSGGPALTESELNNEECNQIVFGLVEDSLREVYAKDITPFESAGAIAEDVESNILKSQLELGYFVYVNWCSENELIALPLIGPKYAKKIIEERRNNGAFSGGKNLADRVPGIGERTVRQLISRLRFSRRPTLIPSPEHLNELIFYLVTKTGVSPDEGLRRILEFTVTSLGAIDKIRWYNLKEYNLRIPDNSVLCQEVGILEGNKYYYWLGDGIDATETTIIMAMFHVAMPTENHPTKQLVQKLVNAKNRGVNVKVLLDRDREKDPYKSTKINEEALEILIAAGVDARFDSEERLLHSKFLVLDNEYSIVGSHNWSAGSYFHYDDLSIVIRSKKFALELQQRFNILWESTE